MQLDKSRVHTALNADEVKIGSMGFFADDIYNLRDVIENKDKSFFGKITEIKKPSEIYRFVKLDADGSSLEYNLFYLVSEPKEEKKYRPYKDTEEMIEDFKERYNSRFDGHSQMPFIWVKDWGEKSLIISFGKDWVDTGSDIYHLNDLFEKFTYLDGSPCGKFEE